MTSGQTLPLNTDLYTMYHIYTQALNLAQQVDVEPVKPRCVGSGGARTSSSPWGRADIGTILGDRT